MKCGFQDSVSDFCRTSNDEMRAFHAENVALQVASDNIRAADTRYRASINNRTGDGAFAGAIAGAAAGCGAGAPFGPPIMFAGAAVGAVVGALGGGGIARVTAVQRDV
jgi:uncharacterized membrane protein